MSGMDDAAATRRISSCYAVLDSTAYWYWYYFFSPPT